ETGRAVVPAALLHRFRSRQCVWGLRAVLGAEEGEQQWIDPLECRQIDVDSHWRSRQQDPLLCALIAEPELHEGEGPIELGLIVSKGCGQSNPRSLLGFNGRTVFSHSRIRGEFDVVLQVGRGALTCDLVADGPRAIDAESRLLGDKEPN